VSVRLLLQTNNVAYQIAPCLMILSDHRGYSVINLYGDGAVQRWCR